MKTLKARKRHIHIRKFRTRIRYNNLAKQRTQRTQHKKNRIINGGSLIGQGNFGCVFRPDIINGNKDIVSKIVLKTNIDTNIKFYRKYLA